MWSPMKCSTLSWLRWGNAIINGQMAHVCRDLLLTHVRMISERAEDDQSEGWRKIWTDLQVPPTPEPALNPHLPWCWVGQQWVCSIFYCYVNWLLRPTCNLNIYIGRFVVAAFYASLQVWDLSPDTRESSFSDICWQWNRVGDDVHVFFKIQIVLFKIQIVLFNIQLVLFKIKDTNPCFYHTCLTCIGNIMPPLPWVEQELKIQGLLEKSLETIVPLLSKFRWLKWFKFKWFEQEIKTQGSLEKCLETIVPPAL